MSPYGVEKITGEHYLATWSKLFGVETVALRYFNMGRSSLLASHEATESPRPSDRRAALAAARRLVSVAASTSASRMR
jgi:UDP-glucose 4-epimerase